MSMYNMVFGENQHSDLLLACLGLSRGDMGRFRDAFIQDGMIAVYTRNGGGNRECWNDDCAGDCTGCHMTNIIPEYKYYISDSDDEFDSTYATIFFEFPPHFKELLKSLEESETPAEKWKLLFEKLEACHDNK